MGDRKDDVRIYVIFVFFFVCSTTGGILLCLYIFLPTSQNGSSTWFAILGLVLVAIPWIIWFLIYLYRCFKPTVDGQCRDRHSHDKPSETPRYGAATEVLARPSSSSYESAMVHHSQSSVVPPDGERHVHFGAVVVVENGSSCDSGSSHGQRQHYKAAVDHHREEFSGELAYKEREDAMLESERPLTSVIRS